MIYTLVNAVPPRTRTKSSPRRAFVCKWNADKWEVTKMRKVGDKGVTCFDVRSVPSPRSYRVQSSELYIVLMASFSRLVPRTIRWAS